MLELFDDRGFADRDRLRRPGRQLDRDALVGHRDGTVEVGQLIVEVDPQLADLVGRLDRDVPVASA